MDNIAELNEKQNFKCEIVQLKVKQGNRGNECKQRLPEWLRIKKIKYKTIKLEARTVPNLLLEATKSPKSSFALFVIE